MYKLVKKYITVTVRVTVHKPKLTREYSRNVASEKVGPETIAAARAFFLFGIPASQFCVCIFSRSLIEAKKLLQFNDQLFPSQSVAIVQPKIEGKQSDAGKSDIVFCTANCRFD